MRWHKVQYACREKPCERKAVTEQIPELPADARVTGRLRRHVAKAVGDGAAVSVACAGLMSWPIAHDAWVVHADALLAEPEQVAVLGIDETHRGRPTWVQDETTGKWRLTERLETNFVDLAGRKACWVRHVAVPRPTSSPGSTSAGRRGRTPFVSSPWTRARPTGPPCARRCRTRGSSPTTSTSCGWPTRPSPTSVGGSPGTLTAAAAARATLPGLTRRRLLRGRERLSNKQFVKSTGGSGTTSRTGCTASTAGVHLGPTRPRATRRDHRSVVARSARLPADRLHQRRHRGHEQDREDRRAHRLRLPQSGQPTPPSTVRLQPARPPGHRPLRVSLPPQVRRATIAALPRP